MMGFFFKKRQSKEADNVLAKSNDEKEPFHYNSEANLHFSLRYVSALVNQEILEKDRFPYLLFEYKK